MTNIKTIKEIDDETWSEFKSMAAKNKMKLGVFFKSILKEHEKTSKNFWKEILNEEKILSDEEAKDINEIIKINRKEYGFRK